MGHQEKMLVGELPNLYCNHIVFISEATLVYLTLNMLLSEVDCFVSIEGTFRSRAGWGGKLLWLGSQLEHGEEFLLCILNMINSTVGLGRLSKCAEDDDAKRTREAPEREQSFHDSNENTQFGACWHGHAVSVTSWILVTSVWYLSLLESPS